MLIIDVSKFGNIERALKAYKKKYQTTHVIDELKSRKEFKKPSVLKRETINKAKHRSKNTPKED